MGEVGSMTRPAGSLTLPCAFCTQSVASLSQASWFRPGLRARLHPAVPWFLPVASGGMTQGKSTGAGLLPRADSSPWGWGSALLCPSRSAHAEQTQETESWRALSQSVL